MARLGELLTAARLVEPEQVERALRAQVVWGARLGTNLVELGAIDLEVLGSELGHQHGMPAAQARHFERADPALQARLPRELAHRCSVIPLVDLHKQEKTVLAALGPLADADLVEIANALGCAPPDLLVAVAPELRIRYHLERVYNVTRSTRFLRLRKSTVTPFPEFDNIPVPVDSEAEVAVPIAVDDTAHPTAAQTLPADEISALIEEAVDAITAREPTEPIGRERRTYVRTLGEAEPRIESPAPRTLARIQLKRVAAPSRSLLDALRDIRRGSNRDRVADLVIDAIDRHVPLCEAALLLVVRGSVAISWKHFSRAGAPAPELAVPLDQPGLVPIVVDENQTARAGAGELGAIDHSLLEQLGAGDGDLVVVPVAIADRVVALLATVTTPDAIADAVEAVALAAAAAFARLLRDASR